MLPSHLRVNGVPPLYREWVALDTGARFPSRINQKKKSMHARVGRSSAALHVPARYARREPWRSPGVYADECERRRSVARPRERIAGAGDLDPAFARIRALTPPAPGARRSRRGVTCCRRIHPDLSPANTSRPVVGEYIQTCRRRTHPDLLSANTSRPVVGDAAPMPMLATRRIDGSRRCRYRCWPTCRIDERRRCRTDADAGHAPH